MSIITQKIIEVGPFKQGFHLITSKIKDIIQPLPEKGMLHLFLQHTSAGICINEAADPDVLHDFSLYFDALAPENLHGIRHIYEGSDDMPAHIKSVLSGCELHIPIVQYQLGLGTWQGIYLCEYRKYGGNRRIVCSVMD